MKTANELNRYTSMRGFKPLPKTSVVEWADTYRILSNGSAEPGRWRTDRAPYQREIMEAFTTPGVSRVVVKSAAQIGKSDIMNNVIGRFAHLDPCPIMMIQPTIEMAQDYSKTRISPMLRDTTVLNRLFYNVKSADGSGTAKTRDGNNTILSKIFPGGRLIMCGANSPAGLASRPVRVLLADEVDRFPDSAGTEGDPVDLAAKRMTTFWNRVMGLFSTPTNEGSSRIDAEYLSGTQEEWQYRCPSCGEYHVLSYIDMYVPDDDYQEIQSPSGHRTILVKSVRWRCPDCGHDFSEREVKEAPQKYVAQNPRAIENGIRSFYVNAFSSPWLEWPAIMKEWYEAKGDPEREKVVMNTRFGLSYRQLGAFEDENIFLRRREQYGADLPDGVLMLTAAVDTQDNRFEYEICGWGADEECWGINKGIVLGEPDKAATWRALDAILDKVYTFKNGDGLKVMRTFIDSGGHYTGAIYKYCEQNLGKQRFPIKGMGGPGIPLNYKIGRAHGTKLPLVMLGVDDGKQMVMNRLGIKDKGARYFHFPLDGDKNFPVRGYDQLYFKGIIAEEKRVIKRGGQIREIWEQIDKTVRNEPLDLRVYNLAAMQSCHPDWERLKGVLDPSTRATETKKAARKPVARTSQHHAAQASRRQDIW